MKWSAGAAAVLIGLAGLPASPTAQETQTYIYDVHGRLVSVDRSAGLDTTYAYDAANNRTLRVVGASDAPSPFELGPPVTNAVGGTYHSSAAPTLAGFSAPVSVTVSGGQYRIGAGGWTTAAGSVTAGQSVQVRVLAPAAGGASQTATLTAGGVSDTFQVTTGIDSTPDDFDLGGVAAAAAGAWAVSNLATITGINVAAPVAITNGQYSIDGGGLDDCERHDRSGAVGSREGRCSLDLRRSDRDADRGRRVRGRVRDPRVEPRTVRAAARAGHLHRGLIARRIWASRESASKFQGRGG